MERYAVLENNVVTNMAMAGADFAAEMGWVLATPAAAIGATWDGSVFTPVGQAAVDLGALRGRLAMAVDDRIAGIYLRWTRFETEYTERESAARAYVAAEYLGECSPWVTSFAEPAGLTLAAAANRIVEQADSLRTALGLLGALRMRKYEITRATDAAAAQVEHDAIMIEADTIEGALQ